MTMDMSVGERVKYFRKLKGLSQEELALKAELNAAFLGHLERGLKSPTIKTLEKIVNALDITLGELFYDEETEDETKQRQEQATQKIIYSVRHLPVEDIEQIANIIDNIVKFKY